MIPSDRARHDAPLLRQLHTGGMLVLPNAWDACSATIVEAAGFPAVATASAAISASLGYADGEGAPWQEMFAAAGRIVRAVGVPVTVDAEAGYGLEPRELVDRLVDIGAAGCNLEDSDNRNGGLVDAQRHAQWLADVRSAATAAGVALVINARTDVFLPSAGVAEAERTASAVSRGRLYVEAGADCVYPIGIKTADDVDRVVRNIPAAVNANPNDVLDLAALRGLGVARASYGPRFYRAGMEAFASAIGPLLGG